jgi:glycosyltransferase involved in cell wall biosynthesis
LKVIAERGSEAHLLIVGEFWEDQAPYMDRIQNLGLSERVHLYARYVADDEVAGFFEVADLFVAPYIGGTQSAALKTALGFGLPVVVTDVITDGMIDALPERCRVVRAGDAEKLAEGILAQMKVAKLDAGQIEQIVEQSWEAMLAVVEGDEG